MKKILLLFIIIIFPLLFLPLATSAETPLVVNCYAQGNCGICDALKLATQIAKYIIYISGSVSLLILIYAGLLLITSQGNPNKIKKAGDIFKGVFIGVVLIFTAWIGVNYILFSFLGNPNQEKTTRIFNRPWPTFTCESATVNSVIWQTNNQSSQTNTSPTTVSLAEACKAPLSDFHGGNCWGFATAVNTNQCVDVSPALERMLACMSALLNAGFGGNTLTQQDIILTSISDDAGLSFCRDNWTASRCAHSQNSCHYGHGQTDGSYAIDVRSRTLNSSQATLLMGLASKAGGNFIDETNISGVAPHYHISAKECGGK